MVLLFLGLECLHTSGEVVPSLGDEACAWSTGTGAVTVLLYPAWGEAWGQGQANEQSPVLMTWLSTKRDGDTQTRHHMWLQMRTYCVGSSGSWGPTRALTPSDITPRRFPQG